MQKNPRRVTRLTTINLNCTVEVTCNPSTRKVKNLSTKPKRADKAVSWRYSPAMGKIPLRPSRKPSAEGARTVEVGGEVGYRVDGNGGPRTGDRKILCGCGRGESPVSYYILHLRGSTPSSTTYGSLEQSYGDIE